MKLNYKKSIIYVVLLLFSVVIIGFIYLNFNNNTPTENQLITIDYYEGSQGTTQVAYDPDTGKEYLIESNHVKDTRNVYPRLDKDGNQVYFTESDKDN